MDLTTVSFAFVAGMVATVNPCGFGMAPAYISMLLGGVEEQPAHGWHRGVHLGLWVTLGFVAVFAAVGAVVRMLSTAIINLVPWMALAVGIGVMLAGIYVLSGRRIGVRGLSPRFRKDGSIRSFVGFGAAYGVASISCTLPVFLAVTAATFSASSAVEGIFTFVAYGAGMGLVLTGVAVSVATSRDALVKRIRRLQPKVERIGGWMMVISGAFVVYYWSVVLAVPVTDPGIWYEPIGFVDDISNSLLRFISFRPWTTAIAFVTVVLVVWLITRVNLDRKPDLTDDGTVASSATPEAEPARH